MAREQQQSEQSELTQLRAEVAMLRAQQQRYEDYQQETEAQKKAYAEFLAWVALSAEQKTQLVADRMLSRPGEQLWEVQLQEHPKVRLPAASRYDAIGKYNQLCGITATAHDHMAAPVAQTPAA